MQLSGYMLLPGTDTPVDAAAAVTTFLAEDMATGFPTPDNCSV